MTPKTARTNGLNAGGAHMDVELIHRCHARTGCLARTPDGAAAVPRPNTLCNACIADLQKRRDQLPALLTALRPFVAAPIAGSRGEPVAASKEPPAPLNVTVLDLIDSVKIALEQMGNVPVRDLVSQTDGLDWAQHIRSLHSRADQIVGFSPVWESRGAPCPFCETFTLGGWVGSGVVHCTNCTSVITTEDYETNCIIQVKER